MSQPTQCCQQASKMSRFGGCPAKRNDRSGASREDAVGVGHGVCVYLECSTETARAAVGWMALESSVWRRIR